LALAVLGSFASGEAQAAMIITSTNLPMTENFDAFAGTIATIPANFTWTPDGTAGTATNFESGLFNPALQAYSLL
jgi:hypothetical protein